MRPYLVDTPVVTRKRVTSLRPQRFHPAGRSPPKPHFPLTPHGEDHYGIPLRTKAIERDEPGPAVRDDQFAQTLFDSAPDQRMVGQDLDRLLDSRQCLLAQRDIRRRVVAKDPFERG